MQGSVNFSTFDAKSLEWRMMENKLWRSFHFFNMSLFRSDNSYYGDQSTEVCQKVWQRCFSTHRRLVYQHKKFKVIEVLANDRKVYSRVAFIFKFYNQQVSNGCRKFKKQNLSRKIIIIYYFQKYKYNNKVRLKARVSFLPVQPTHLKLFYLMFYNEHFLLKFFIA